MLQFYKMKEQKIRYFSLVYHFLTKEKKDILFIYLYSAISGLVYLSLPLSIQGIVSFASGGVMATSIFVLILFAILGTWLVGFLRIQVMKIIEKIQQKIFVDYSIAFAEKFAALELKKTNQYYLPELANRVFDANNLQKSVSKILLDIPLATIKIVLGIILLGFYHPWFIVFGLFVFALMFVIFKITFDAGITSSIKESDKKYEVAYWIESIANSITSLKSYIKHEMPFHKVDDKLGQYIDNRTNHFNVLKFQYKTIVAFKVLSTLVMLVLCSYLLINQKINIGAFIAAELVIMTIIAGVEKLIISLESYYDTITSLVKLNKVLDLPEEPTGIIPFEYAETGIDVECRDISFGYSDDLQVLKNITITIPANSITLLSGKMTSGKTTLAKILSGLLNINSGSILYNKISLNNYKREDVYAAVGYCADDMKIFSGTILENIQVGNKNITLQQVITLANQLGLNKIFDVLPNAYHTKITENQTALTYSTRKSILLLKTFLGKHRMIILEEPCSGMSNVFCENFLAYIKQISATKNVVIISEDEQFKAVANRVYYLQNGEIKNN